MNAKKTDIFSLEDISDLPRAMRDATTKKQRSRSSYVELVEMADGSVSAQQVMAARFRHFGKSTQLNTVRTNLDAQARKGAIRKTGNNSYAAKKAAA